MNVELDYILDIAVLQDTCEHDDRLADLDEWEMLMRLRIGAVEVFGHTDDEYHAWQESLRRHDVSLHVPSPAWSRLSVLWIASSVEEAFSALQRDGHSDLPSLDCVIRLVRHDENVAVTLRPDRTGHAPLVEVQAAFEAFAERVRTDFLAVCPRLAAHPSLGYWFRNEDPPPPVSSLPILL